MASFYSLLTFNRFSGNGALSPVSEDENAKVARRLTLVRHLRAPAFQYAWTFYHDKYTESQNYEGRLTLMKEDIVTAKPFWEVLNSFPFDALKLKDSVHFFKRGVKPVWEDPRNVKGGSWTFRVPKAQSVEFWKEVLMLAVGEEFVDVSPELRPQPRNYYYKKHSEHAGFSEVVARASEGGGCGGEGGR
ncbi:translation initiation factor eIF 4e-like domain-containing protein [Usnea florida]